MYAHREDVDRHVEYRAWLDRVLRADSPYGLADLVLSGFLRIVTHPKVFATPTPLPRALAFCDGLRSHPNATVLGPGPRHWQIFTGLCTDARVRGNLFRTRTSPRWRSSRAASGSRPTATTAASPISASGIRSPSDRYTVIGAGRSARRYSTVYPSRRGIASSASRSRSILAPAFWVTSSSIGRSKSSAP